MSLTLANLRQPRGLVLGLVLGAILGGIGGVVLVTAHPHFAANLRRHLAGLLGTTRPAPTSASRQFTVGRASNAGAPLQVRVDSNAPGRPINPLIYGIANASAATVRSLGATSNRWGGNQTTRFNWNIGHAWNAARDWAFRNGNYGHTSGSYSDQFVAQTLSAGATPLMTVPMLGWVARNDDNNTFSRGVPWQGGPPLNSGSQAIPGYDPTANRARTSVASLPRNPGLMVDTPDPAATTVYQDEWVHHLVNQFGFGSKGVSYFAMDNEPDLWSTTHTDVHPARMGYDDMLKVFEAYAPAVKAQDPSARVLGPDVSGWTSYLYSELDRGSDNFSTHADRQAHGNVAFLPWWLHQVAVADRARGQRSLDLLDVHYYPQASKVFSSAHDPATRALRIRSVRSLFDKSYSDESWIGQPVALIPRLKQWVASEYPGTGIAITEYNWGGERDASGAVALAEALGTFGREGVDMANYWSYPPLNSPAAAAFRLFRNFDGNGSAFGDVSLPVTVTQPGVAAFGASHSDRREVDIILANESADVVADPALSIAPGGHWKAQDYVIDAGSAAIREVDLPGVPDHLSLAPMSVHLLRLVAA